MHFNGKHLLACVVRGGQELLGNCFLSPAGLKRPPRIAQEAYVPLLVVPQVPRAWQEDPKQLWVQRQLVFTYTLVGQLQ